MNFLTTPKRTTWLTLTIGLFALALTTTVLLHGSNPSPSSSTQPKITWSVASVYAGITSTTTVMRTVSFTSNQTLQGLVVEAVPQIAGFVQIQPNTFPTVPAAKPQTVQLTFSAPVGAQFGAYDGTIHLRIGSSTLPQTLKTSVTFAVVPLPPDPGAAGKTTLAGIDSDGDGVRDDLERWIALTYSASARTRAALTQVVVADQTFLEDASSKTLTVQDSMAIKAGGDCLSFIRPSDYGDIMIKEESQVANTTLRSKAYIQANNQLGGQFYKLPANDQERIAQCNFNVLLLPN